MAGKQKAKSTSKSKDKKGKHQRTNSKTSAQSGERSKRSGGGKSNSPTTSEKTKKQTSFLLLKQAENKKRIQEHNKKLKHENIKILDVFAEKDVELQKYKQLNSNARREIDYKAQKFEKIRDSLINVEPRINFQHKNVRGLVAYAKKLTVDLEAQK